MTSQEGEGATAPSRHVAIAVRCYQSTVTIPFLNSALDSQLLFASRGVPLSVMARCGDCHHDDAMNALFLDFLSGPYTDFVSIDSDEGWKAEDLWRICNHDRDIVGAAIPKKQDKEEYTLQIEAPEIWSDAEGLVECHCLGSGFIRFRRNVVQAMWDESEEYEEPVTGRTLRMMWFRSHGRRRWGADFWFCLRAKELGFKVFVDPNVTIEHVGRHMWRGNLLDYWSRLNGA